MIDIDKTVKKEIKEFQGLLDGNHGKYKSTEEFITHHIKKIKPPHASEIIASYLILNVLEKSLGDALIETLAEKGKIS